MGNGGQYSLRMQSFLWGSRRPPRRHGRWVTSFRGAAILLFVLLSAGCLGGFTPFRPEFVYPSIRPVEGAPSHPVSFTFPFEGTSVTLTVPISGPVFYGAQQAEKSAGMARDEPDARWLPGYYQAFISDPAQDGFYRDALSEFRRVREELQLDSDRYAELLAVAVQSMPYQADGAGGAPQFPVETFAERTGDCDDKSLLLAGLLSQEGYRVAILFFGEENHMAVGIAADDCGYRSTSYGFLETTNRSLVGIPPDKIDGPLTVLSTDPLVIPIGNGTLTYGACDETQGIHAALARARDALASLDPLMAARQAEMEGVRGNPAEYHRLEPGYRSMVDEHNRKAEIINYVQQHLHDRTGTYRWLKSRGLVPG